MLKEKRKKWQRYYHSKEITRTNDKTIIHDNIDGGGLKINSGYKW